MNETEIKILYVNPKDIASKLEKLGAEKILQTHLTVDWFRPVGEKEGEENWFLRIRSYSDGKSEVTWKGKSEILGKSRTHKEINFTIESPEQMSDLFLVLGLKKYAHQEKDRISWKLKDWRFDLDQYPEMPAYLEIEGKNEDHISKGMQLLELQTYKTSSEGERVLIQEEYGLNWYEMKF